MRPYFDVPCEKDGNVLLEASIVADWIESKSIEILNIAGNAHFPVEQPVERYLISLFELLLGAPE